jgi:hypothetical protein
MLSIYNQNRNMMFISPASHISLVGRALTLFSVCGKDYRENNLMVEWVVKIVILSS